MLVPFIFLFSVVLLKASIFILRYIITFGAVTALFASLLGSILPQVRAIKIFSMVDSKTIMVHGLLATGQCVSLVISSLKMVDFLQGGHLLAIVAVL